MSATDPVSGGDGLSGSGNFGNGDSGNAHSGSLDSGNVGTSSAGTGHHGSESNGAATNGSANGVNGVLATLDNRVAAVPALNWSYGPPPKPDILSAKPGPVELTHAVRRRWGLSLGLGLLVGSVAAGLVAFFVPVKYEAFSLLQVSNRPPSVMAETASGIEEFAIFKRTQIQLILSGIVLQRTVVEPDINRLSIIRDHDDDPTSWLKEQLIIDYPDDAEILRVAIKGRMPGELRKIIDKVVEKYLQEIVQHERDVRMQNEERLEKTLQQYQSDLTTGRDSLHKMANLHKTSSSEVAQSAKRLALDELRETMNKRSRLLQAFDDNELKIAVHEAEAERPEEFRAPPNEFLIDIEMSKDAEIAMRNQKISGLNDMLSEALQHTKHPATDRGVKTIRQKIQKLEDEIDERKSVLAPRLRELMSGSGGGGGHNSFVEGPEVLKAKKESLEKMLAEIQGRVTEQIEALDKMENFNAQVASKEEELRALDRMTNDLRARLDRAKVERLARERIILLDKAILASGSGDAIRKYVAVVFSGLLGFGLVVLGVAFTEFQSRKVNSVEEVNDGLGIRVIGELPSVSGRIWRRMKGGQGPAVLKALMAERIDGTRTALIHTAVVDPPRVVMVTSAEPHEGKTTTASQLAASLARSGRRTLLVDADIRNPGAHRVFDMPQDPGLCELLRGEVERDAVLHPTRTANLWLLPAGRCDLQSVQALSTSYLGTTIAALCVQFDYVVIDSGPVLKVADPLLVGQHVDAVIISVLRDVSKVPKVYEACERLRSVGISVLGSVVNGVNDDSARHGVELLMAEATHAAQPTAVGPPAESPPTDLTST